MGSSGLVRRYIEVSPGGRVPECGVKELDRIEPVLAGAGYVHFRLVHRFGIAVEHVGVVDGGAYVWWIRQPTRPSFLIRFTREALQAKKAELETWVDAVADDARESQPASGGFYVVEPDGIKAIGMDDFEFEEYGQRVHLYIDLGPPKVWRLEVDAVDEGVLMAADSEDERDEVARQAIAALTVKGRLRIPEQPWSWSVVDGRGREWWGRLERSGSGSCHLVLREVTGSREHRLVWASEQPPLGSDLRRLVEAA